jgi:hypothetical protein
MEMFPGLKWKKRPFLLSRAGRNILNQYGAKAKVAKSSKRG